MMKTLFLLQVIFRNPMPYLFVFRFYYIASRFQYSSLLIQVRFSKNASSKLVDLIDKNKSWGNKEICALRPQKALRMRHEIHIFDKSLAEDLWPFKWTTINATPWTAMRRNVEFSLRFFALFFLFQDFGVRRRQWKQVMRSCTFHDTRASIGLSTSSTFADPLRDRTRNRQPDQTRGKTLVASFLRWNEKTCVQDFISAISMRII